MNKALKITGFIVILLTIGSLFSGALQNPILGIILMFCSVMLGIAFIIIGELMERVKYLEEYLKTSKRATTEDNQKECQGCGKKHDINYYRCPYCGYE